MTYTVATEMVVLARRAAELLPPPPAMPDEDHLHLQQQWEDLALSVAGGLARRADHDADLLRGALWPPVDACTEPTWRVLLTIALLVAESHAGSVERLPALSTPTRACGSAALR